MTEAIERQVERFAPGRLAAAPDSAAHTIAWHRGPDGELLTTKTAAVELINVLRPFASSRSSDTTCRHRICGLT